MKKIAGVPLEEIIEVMRENNGNASATARQLGMNEKYLQSQVRFGKYAKEFDVAFPDRIKRAKNVSYINSIRVECRNQKCSNTVLISIIPGDDPETYDKRRYCNKCKETNVDPYHTTFRDMTECWA